MASHPCVTLSAPYQLILTTENYGLVVTQSYQISSRFLSVIAELSAQFWLSVDVGREMPEAETQLTAPVTRESIPERDVSFQTPTKR